ncbi:hypothetical protein FA13DRAFT_1157013 [Coprinellus micaceus]|uniref:Uncharacterized protein n=1 Tax=Coprinellus micaceus TaxID=71717 RepID=A0A4Y7SUE1_COPMI|nr:hypothetical protein FA13DRAFT_1157013 [Coprinellus micaceus]
MTVFSKVVTGVKKRIPTSNSNSADNDEAASLAPGSIASQSAGSSSTTQRRQTHKQSPVAPDLRRFSGFMNPFPNVQPGGYTKYYQARAAAAAGGGSDASSGGSGPSPYALPSLCELNQRPPPPSSRRPPSIQTSGLQGRGASKSRSSGSGSSSRSQKTVSNSHVASSPLTAIPETSSEQESLRAHTSHSRSHSARTSSSQPLSPLKRRKGRMLRTPSVEKDFAAAGSPTVTSLGRAPSGSSSKSRSSSHRSCPSTDSHSTDTSLEYPQTPEDASPVVLLPTTLPPSAFKFSDPYANYKTRDSGISMGLGLGVGVGLGFTGDGDWEPFERPDSRSTYRTARTHFDDF